MKRGSGKGEGEEVSVCAERKNTGVRARLMRLLVRAWVYLVRVCLDVQESFQFFFKLSHGIIDFSVISCCLKLSLKVALE